MGIWAYGHIFILLLLFSGGESRVIELTGLRGEKFLLNVALIERVDFVPDTKIVLTNGHYYFVKEGKEDIINKSIEYYKKTNSLLTEQNRA